MDVKSSDSIQMLQEEETPISDLALKELSSSSLNEKKSPVSPSCARLTHNRPIRNHEQDIYVCIFWLGQCFIMENLLARPRGALIGIYDDFKKNVIACLDRMKKETSSVFAIFLFWKEPYLARSKNSIPSS